MTTAWGVSWGVAWGHSWDIVTPVPPTRSSGDGPGFEVGDNYVRIGNVVRWIKRPTELEPVKAEEAAVKKVAKSLGISKDEARNVVAAVQREVGTQVNLLRAANMATSGKQGDLVTRQEAGDMRRYWALVVAAAIETEEEEIMLLLT